MKQPILIIEDNLPNMELMTYLLEAFGYPVLSACNGAEGLQLARSNSPILILCDIGMSVMDGYEVARQIKRDSALKHIPLLAVTAYAMVGDRDKILAANFDGYFTKPIDPETFVGQIEAFLKPDRASSVPSLPPRK